MVSNILKHDTWSSRKINDELDTINDEMIVVNDRDTTNNVTDKTKLVIGLNNEEVELVTMEEFNEVKEDIDELRGDVFSYGLQKVIYTQTMMSGYYAEPSANVISLKTSGTSDSIYFFTDKDLSVYFEDIPTAPYFSICVANRPTATEWKKYTDFYQIQNNGPTYRCRISDNNLPTKENKLMILKGALVVITITKGYDAYLCFDDYDKTKLNSNIVINTDNILDNNLMKFHRDPNGWSYIRMGNMLFAMSVYSMSGANTNIFRFRECHIMDGNSKIMLVWNSDEDAEGVIKLLGETDFIGGYHGSEQMQSCYILLDGEIISNSGKISECFAKNISIIVESDVYHCWRDASVKDNIAFRRLKKIVFENNSISISNCWKSIGINKVISAPLMLFQTKFGDNQVKYYTNNTDLKLWEVPKTSDAQLPVMSKDLTRFDIFLYQIQS